MFDLENAWKRVDSDKFEIKVGLSVVPYLHGDTCAR